MKNVSLACASLILGVASTQAVASSHREAPFTAMNPTIDATDLYMFRSYEQGRDGYVTVMANYIPFQDPQGGPNFYQFNPSALYEIHIDNNGDAVEDLTFQFRFNNTSKDQALNIGGKQTKIPLINSNRISGVNDPALNVRETFTVDLVRGNRRSGTRAGALTNASGGSATFDKPVDNIGEKTFPRGYAQYASQHIYNVAIPGCTTQGKVFVGQRKEPFYIAIGKVMDLFNLNPLGAEVGGNNNDLEGKNVTTLALELPISCVATLGDSVIGAFTTASLRQSRLINGAPGTGLNTVDRSGGAWAQVSRLGMPLVNEVVIGTSDKNRFNASKPKDDGQFLDYVTHPALPALLESLFPVKAPTRFPRTDLVATFLTGIEGLNKPKNVVPSEMLRLNLAIAPKAAAAQSAMGVPGGDLAGFPNGRRPADDVVDLSLRVAMGALCHLTGAADTFKVGCNAGDATSGALPLTDGVRKTAANYGSTFPYFTTPIPGNINPPAPVGVSFP